jgi:outer membrane protein TolC
VKAVVLALTLTLAAPAGASAPSTPLQVLGRELTLEESVEIALSTQPQIQARLNDYAAARYRVTQTIAPLLPQLSGNVTATKSHTPTTETTRNLFINSMRVPRGTPDLTVTSLVMQGFNDSFAAQVSLSQLLFDFGKNMAGVDAARRLADVALEDVELQRQLVALAVREAYTNLLLARRLADVQRQALERTKVTLVATQRAVDVGLRAEADVARAEVDVANAEIDVIRATNAILLGRAALNTAIGIEVTTPIEIQDNLAYRPAVFDRETLFAESLRQRPEYRQARLRVDVGEALERQAFRNFFPDITGSGSYGGVQFPQFSESWIVGLTMSWTFFDGGGKVARYQESKANLEASRARLASTALDVSRDVEQAVVTATEAQQRIQAARKVVQAAERNFKFAEGRFRSGLATIIELTDAQFSLTQAHAVEMQALSDFRLALYRLDRAVGRR